MKVEDVIAEHPEEITELFYKLRALILSLDERIDEDVYGGKVVKMVSFSVSRTDNVMAVLSPSENHCKLFLHYPDDIDAMGLKLEGKGKHARHIKIKPSDPWEEDKIQYALTQVLAIVLTKV